MVRGSLLAVALDPGRQTTAAETDDAGFVPILDGRSFD